MIQPKNFVAAFAFVGLLTTSNIASAEGDIADLYVEGGVAYANVDDVVASFTSGAGAVTNASWDLSDLVGGKLQIGADFGPFRTDVKVRLYEGDVDAISGGVSAVNSGTDPEGPKALLGVATVNAYVDIYDLKLGDVASITPFVGLGAGYARGFMQAEGTLAGVRRNDHKSSGSHAWVGTLGVLLAAGPVGLTADYEYIDTNFTDAHTASAGIRLSF